MGCIGCTLIPTIDPITSCPGHPSGGSGGPLEASICCRGHYRVASAKASVGFPEATGKPSSSGQAVALSHIFFRSWI